MLITLNKKLKTILANQEGNYRGKSELDIHPAQKKIEGNQKLKPGTKSIETTKNSQLLVAMRKLSQATSLDVKFELNHHHHHHHHYLYRHLFLFSEVNVQNQSLQL